MIAAACVLVPPLAAAVLAVLPAGWGARANLLAAALTAGLAACLPWAPAAEGGWLLADGPAVPLAVLTGFVGLTTAWFNLGHVAAQAEEGRLVGARLRVYHASFQAVLGGALLALLSDDLGVTWAALAAASLAAVLAAGLPGTPEAVGAAWRGFVPVWAGAALALFGTVALYAAALPVLGPGRAAMSWSGLADAAPGASGAMLSLAGAVLLVGYGVLAAPPHGWTPGPRAAGPVPVCAILSGVVPVAALAVLLRLRGVLASNPQAVPPGPPLLALGLVCVVLAGFGLWRRRDVAGFFALHAVGRAGVVCLGFGVGTPAATAGGLLHLAAHTLAGAAVLQCAARAARPGDGPAPSHPAAAVPFAAGALALAGLPPFGVFAGGFLVLTELAREAPGLLVPAGAGALAGAWALVARLQGWCFGDPRAATPSVPPGIDPRRGGADPGGRRWEEHRWGGSFRGGDASGDGLTAGTSPAQGSSASGPPGQAPGDASRPAPPAGPDAERHPVAAPTRGDGGTADGVPDRGAAPGRAADRAALAGAWLNLAAALALGASLPAPLAAWLRATAEALP